MGSIYKLNISGAALLLQCWAEGQLSHPVQRRNHHNWLPWRGGWRWLLMLNDQPYLLKLKSFDWNQNMLFSGDQVHCGHYLCVGWRPLRPSSESQDWKLSKVCTSSVASYCDPKMFQDGFDETGKAGYELCQARAKIHQGKQSLKIEHKKKHCWDGYMLFGTFL